MTKQPGIDTSQRFGFEWDRYDDFFPHYEKQFLGWIAPLEPEDFVDLDVLDAGCGMGRNSYWAAQYGARSILAVDYSELALRSARRVLAKIRNAGVERFSLYDLPHHEAFDLCFSIGVIHHLEHPRLAVEKLLETLRPGGKLVVWLYGYEGNERFVEVFKRIHPMLRSLAPETVHKLAYAASIPLYLGLKLPFSKTEYLGQIAHFPFRHLHKIVFDQLLPDIAHYYKRHEVDELFGDLDLAKVQVHHNRGYSWTVICEKRS